MSLYATFCQQMTVVTPEQSLVVAFSGGLDSSVLLALAARWAKEQGVAVKAVHIAHGLQTAAQVWPQHCASVAQSLGVPYQTIQVQVALGPRVSVEAAAREARYQALSEVMQPGGILLTGHHLDDQAETLLLALKRGAGVSGLAAMPVRKSFGPAAKSNQQWRPLLACSRHELETYAHSQRLTWVEDPSNSDNSFDRNFLRNQVLPILQKQWPTFNNTLARSAELCAEQMDLADEIARQDLAELLINSVDVGLANEQAAGLQITGLQALSPARRNNVLRHWAHLQHIYPSRRQLQAIWQEVALARNDATPEIRLGEARVCRYQGALYVPAISSIPVPVAALEAETWHAVGVGRLRLTWVSSGADLIGDLLPKQLQLVFNRNGLRAQPHGRAGSRPLKKLWQEYGVPPWRRSSMPLLLQGDQLVAIPGLFVSQTYTPKPEQAGWRIDWENTSSSPQNSKDKT